MTIPFDTEAIGKDIVDTLNGILNDDISRYVSFFKSQTLGLAKQAAWIAEATATGEIDADTRDWFIGNLQRMTEDFIRTLVGLTLLTIEKAWNAVVGILWGAINTALDAASIPIQIPVPSAPSS